MSGIIQVFLLLFAILVISKPLIAQGKPASVTGNDNFKVKLQENLKIASDSFKQKKALLQKQLQTINDASKSAQVLKINDKIARINKQRTEQMAEALDRMTAVLLSLLGKIDLAKAGGADTTQVDLVALAAKTSLKTAQDAVASQSAKVYVPEASDGAGLKVKVGAAVSQLQADLRTVHSLVVDAKQAIAAVIRELAKTGVGKIGQKDKTASSSPALIQPFIPK